MNGRLACFLVLLISQFLAASDDRRRNVAESARGIPLAHKVDVAVVGGSTGAVAAAVAAAKEGASVFLLAPQPYLGEDMTATLRLWLEDGETPSSPLAQQVFDDPCLKDPLGDPVNLVRFSYEADCPPAASHKDTQPPSLLADHQWGSATSQSVQYDGDVTITLDLGKQEDLSDAHIMVYHSGDFRVDTVNISASGDGKAWQSAATISNSAIPQGSVAEPALILSTPLKTKARYLKFLVKRSSGSKRVLLGEIAVVRAATSGSAASQPTQKVTVPVRPLHVKKVLDDALLTAGVEYLYSCYATDLLRDRKNNPCGIVMANRAGRQAVQAKIIIDATDRAWVARMAGTEFRPFPPGRQTLRRVVIGGEPRSGEGIRCREIRPPFTEVGRTFRVFDYALEIPMQDGRFASWAKAEQVARDMTYHPDQQFTSDCLWQIPPDPMKGQTQVADPWKGAGALDLRAFRPANSARVFVLGGCADVPRQQAERLLRPMTLMELGSRIGIAAAKEAKSLPDPQGVRVPGRKGPTDTPGDTHEILVGVRPIQSLPTVPQESRTLPVLGMCDVVVIGGGTSGAPAGIGAARQGARTLVVEYLHGLGGVGTQGAITAYYWGNRVGFSSTVYGGTKWDIEPRTEWWRTTLAQAGGEVWFGTIGCGAFVHEGRVKGAVVATPEGRGVILAGVVIDSTGNADIAAAAGAPCLYTDETDVAIQGTGLPPLRLGRSYTNTDFTIVDETDMMDVWHVFVYAKHRATSEFDIGRLIDTRERRRIVGDLTISILDQVNQRTYPDTIVETYSDFDTHGYTIDPYFTLEHPPAKQGFRTHIPYRALLPKDLDGILVTGLGVSAHRDAVPVIRMQPDVQNQGYAAGVAAATAAKAGIPTRKVDVRTLQKHLAEIGNIPNTVLNHTDSYPLPSERIAAAVETARDGYKGISVILAQPQQALPLLREAYSSASNPDHKLAYAHILAVLGDATGVDVIAKAIDAITELDQGWQYRGMGQFGANMSRLDSLIYALGCTQDPRAVAPILSKLQLLTPESDFSHFRAAALALEKIADPSAAPPLADLLSRPEIRGHASTTVADAIQQTKQWPSWNATEPRSTAIRELLLARALYRCGDKGGLGKKVLLEYTKDLRGHLARHAHAVLQAVRKPGPKA